MAAILGFNLFLFSGGRLYAFEQLRDRPSEAGFAEYRHRRPKKPESSPVVARKRG